MAPGERDHRDQHGEGEKGRTFGQTVEVLDLVRRLIRHDDQHSKTEQRHEQIRDEIIGDGRAGKRNDADQQITRVGDARVGEQPFEISLRKRGEISVDQGQERDADEQTCICGNMKNGASTRSRTTKPAAFEPTERKAVTGVGAP